MGHPNRQTLFLQNLWYLHVPPASVRPRPMRYKSRVHQRCRTLATRTHSIYRWRQSPVRQIDQHPISKWTKILAEGILGQRENQPLVIFANPENSASFAQTISPSSKILPAGFNGSTMPPASRTISIPAARSHALNRRSQKPS